MKRTSRVLLVGFAGLSAVACSPAVTFPPEQGVLTSSQATTEPIPTLMAVSIEYAHAQWGTSEDFAINLPAGTPPKVYDRVIKRLGAGRPMMNSGEPAYHVTRVVSAGFDADVDLFYPTRDGAYEFITLSFHREAIGGWLHQYTRAWSIGDQPPPPNYVGPSDEPLQASAHATDE